LIELWLIVQGVGLDVMSFHEIARADTTLFGTAISVGFGAWSVVKLSEG
jgi:hypothetical protein